MDLLFVSSTFQDMQYERDAIRDLVMPRLNKEAHEYGQSVSVCDLRIEMLPQAGNGSQWILMEQGDCRNGFWNYVCYFRMGTGRWLLWWTL